MLSAAGAQIASQKYAIIAFSPAFVYDCLLTLDDEIMYIWRRQFSLVTLAYFINRYYAMICFALLIFVNFSVAIDASVMFLDCSSFLGTCIDLLAGVQAFCGFAGVRRWYSAVDHHQSGRRPESLRTIWTKQIYCGNIYSVHHRRARRSVLDILYTKHFFCNFRIARSREQ